MRQRPLPPLLNQPPPQHLPHGGELPSTDDANANANAMAPPAATAVAGAGTSNVGTNGREARQERLLPPPPRSFPPSRPHPSHNYNTSYRYSTTNVNASYYNNPPLSSYHHQQQQYQPQPQPQQYQHAGGVTLMTEEKLRRFTEQQQQQQQQQEQATFSTTAVPPLQQQTRDALRLGDPEAAPSSPAVLEYYGTRRRMRQSATPSATTTTPTKQHHFTTTHMRATSCSPPSTSSVAMEPGGQWQQLDHHPNNRLEDFHTVFRVPLHVPDARYKEYLAKQMGRHPQHSSSDNNNTAINTACCAQTCVYFSAVAVAFLLLVGILLDTQPLFIPGTLPPLVVQSTVTYQSAAAVGAAAATATADVATDGTSSKRRNTKYGSSGGGGSGSTSTGGSIAQNEQQTVRSYSQPRIQFLVPGPSDGRLPTAVTAYQTAFAYFVTMLLSLYTVNPTPFHSVLIRMASTILQRPPFPKKYSAIPDTPTATSTGNSDMQLPIHNYETSNNNSYSQSFTAGETILDASGGSVDRDALFLLGHEPHKRHVSYQKPDSLWDHTTTSIQRWLAVRGWHRGRKFRKYGEMKKG